MPPLRAATLGETSKKSNTWKCYIKAHTRRRSVTLAQGGRGSSNALGNGHSAARLVHRVGAKHGKRFLSQASERTKSPAYCSKKKNCFIRKYGSLCMRKQEWSHPSLCFMLAHPLFFTLEERASNARAPKDPIRRSLFPKRGGGTGASNCHDFHHKCRTSTPFLDRARRRSSRDCLSTRGDAAHSWRGHRAHVEEHPTPLQTLPAGAGSCSVAAANS